MIYDENFIDDIIIMDGWNKKHLIKEFQVKIKVLINNILVYGSRDWIRFNH